MAPFFVVSMITMKLWEIFEPLAHHLSPMFPPPPPPPPPTRCYKPPGWLDTDVISHSMGISSSDADALALQVFLSLFVGFFSLGTFHLLSRADGFVRRLGFRGPWPLAAMFVPGRLAAELLAVPAPDALLDRDRHALTAQRYHARLRELKAKRERKVAFSLHWIKSLSRKQLASLRKERPQMREGLSLAEHAVDRMESYVALYQATSGKLVSETENSKSLQARLDKAEARYKMSISEKEAACDEVKAVGEKLVNSECSIQSLERSKLELETLVTQANEACSKTEKDRRALRIDLRRSSEKLVNSERRVAELETLLAGVKESNIGLQADYRKVLKDNDKAMLDRQAALQRVGAAERRTSQVEAELRALRVPEKPSPTVEQHESQASVGELGTASVNNDPAEADPEGPIEVPSRPPTALRLRNDSREQAPQDPPASAGLSSIEVDAAADQPETANVAAAPSTGLCWATNTKPCQGDVSKGAPCIGNPDEYDAQHNLIYDWTAPDLYYGPYRASTHEREKKQGSLARKKGLCVDCFNARSEVVPAAIPYGAREPVTYLF